MCQKLPLKHLPNMHILKIIKQSSQKPGKQFHICQVRCCSVPHRLPDGFNFLCSFLRGKMRGTCNICQVLGKICLWRVAKHKGNWNLKVSNSTQCIEKYCNQCQSSRKVDLHVKLWVGLGVFTTTSPNFHTRDTTMMRLWEQQLYIVWQYLVKNHLTLDHQWRKTLEIQ